MPMSWLTPADVVQRSAFALTRPVEVAVGVKLVITRLAASISFQVLPSLPLSKYCVLVNALASIVVGVGTNSTVSRLGEELGPAPAAAKMMPLVGLFDFPTSCTVYDVEPTTGMTVCTKAALGEKVPGYP